MFIRKKFLVFYLPTCWASTHNMIYPLEWMWLNEHAVDLFWVTGDKLSNVFKKFLTKGFVGIVWHNKATWASYAWMSLPETDGPIHMMRSIRNLSVYWIFYCRTRDKYQGQGLFKSSLSLLSCWAREREPEAKVYIDTEPNNISSRRAIGSVGFLPKGIITTWTLQIPRHERVIWGHWNPNACHPAGKGYERKLGSGGAKITQS